MGKGYNNYMCKKPFHPGSKANIKRAWMAEQKTENEKKKQEELKVQYEKEQDLYNNRALLSTESKDKLELNFMYEAPPGAKRERQKEDDEPEFKFEWQRKYNAPREDYAKGNADIKDQPFGIPVRNVRCIKCHKWGHINTDKECPLFSQASTSSMPTTSMDPMELMRQMREDGYNLKENVLGHQLNPKAANQQFLPSDESDPEMEFLKSLSASEKKKLLRKLKKLSKKQAKTSSCKKKKSKKSGKSKSKEKTERDHHTKKKSKQDKESSDDSTGDSSSEASSSDHKMTKHTKKSKHKRETSLSSESDSESGEPPRKSKHSTNESIYTKVKETGKKKSSVKTDLSKRKGKYLKNENELEERSRRTKSSKNELESSKIEKAEGKGDSEKYDSKKRKEKYSNSENDAEKYTERPEVSKSKHSNKEKINRISNQSVKKRKHSESESSFSEFDEKKCYNPSTKDLHKQSPDKTKEMKKNSDHVECQDTKRTKSGKDDDPKPEKPANMADSKLKNGEPKSAESKKKEESALSVIVTTCNSPIHPDGFSHLYPQARIEANYLLAEEEYAGNIHDKFRHFHRERRSPSVKQKYNK